MDFERVQKVSWFPGHMLKAERELRERLAAVDLVVELVDARAPLTTQNPRLAAITGHKPRAIVMGKTDLADPEATTAWRRWFREQELPAYAIHYRQLKQLPALLEMLKTTAREDERCRWGSRLAYNRPLRIVVVGMPNVGKSTLINALVGRRRAKTGPKPGVTRSQQWVLLGDEIEMLDTPGIMVPDVVTPQAGLTLALLALVREEVVGPDIMAEFLLYQMTRQDRQTAFACYDIPALPATVGDLLDQAGMRLGQKKPGGEVDTFQTALHLVRDFQAGKLGRLSLELPPS